LHYIFLAAIYISVPSIATATCYGYAGPGGPCYAGPGGGAYAGPGGLAYAGPGGGAYAGPGGRAVSCIPPKGAQDSTFAGGYSRRPMDN
jgi:hypothetical protein